MKRPLIIGALFFAFAAGWASNRVLTDPLNYCRGVNASYNSELVTWCAAYVDTRLGLLSYARAHPDAVQ